jgi:hypothetical protein
MVSYRFILSFIIFLIIRLVKASHDYSATIEEGIDFQAGDVTDTPDDGCQCWPTGG